MSSSSMCADHSVTELSAARGSTLRALQLLACSAAAFGVIIALGAGCGGKDTSARPENRPPTINGIMLDPGRVAPGDTVQATAVAGDPEGTPITYQWKASAGSFLDSLSRVATWLAPGYATSCSLTVTVRDDANQTSLTTVFPVGLGTLVVESYPQGATVFIDSEPTQYTTPVTLPDSPTGTYTVSVQGAPYSYYPGASSVDVTHGGTATATFKLNENVMSLTQMTTRDCASQSSWAPSGGQMAGAMKSSTLGWRKILIFTTPWPDYIGDYLETGGEYDWAPSLCPTGCSVLFASSRTGMNRIYSVPLSGGMAMPVYGAEANFPVWAPDAAKFAFVARDGVGFSLVTTTAPGVMPTIVAEDVLEDRPSWKPDGSQIAFTKEVGGEPYIFVTPSSGGTVEQVSHVPGSHPHWSPDGTMIAFVSSFDGVDNVWVLFLREGAEALDGWLTSQGADWPAWRPVGMGICYAVPYPSEDCPTVWLAENFPF